MCVQHKARESNPQNMEALAACRNSAISRKPSRHTTRNLLSHRGARSSARIGPACDTSIAGKSVQFTEKKLRTSCVRSFFARLSASSRPHAVGRRYICIPASPSPPQGRQGFWRLRFPHRQAISGCRCEGSFSILRASGSRFGAANLGIPAVFRAPQRFPPAGHNLSTHSFSFSSSPCSAAGKQHQAKPAARRFQARPLFRAAVCHPFRRAGRLRIFSLGHLFSK